MFKKKLFYKKFTKLVLSITDRIESFFNLFRGWSIVKGWNIVKKKYFNASRGTTKRNIFIGLISIFLAIVVYFSLPSFYDKNKIKAHIENQILQRYNFEIELNENLQYNLFPKPNFSSKNIEIIYGNKIISKSENTRFFLSISDFLNFDNIDTKNTIFKGTKFKIDKSKLNFFFDLLNNNTTNQNIDFIDSKFFYLDQYDEVIFLADIKRLNYLFFEDFLNEVKTKLNVFNLPVNFLSRHDLTNKNIFTEINLNSIKLKIENNLNYKSNEIAGELKLNFINNRETVNYNLKNKNLTYAATDRNIKGEINIKPFFLSSNLEFKNLQIKKIFDEDSIIVNLFKSEILNNINLNGKISVIINNLDDLKHVGAVKFDIQFEEGVIFISNLNFIFKDSVIFNFRDVNLIVDNDQLKFIGDIIMDFKNMQNFYSYFQIKRNYRKNIDRINSSFVFNLDNNLFELNQLEIDGVNKEILSQFLNDLNSKEKDFFNKVTIKNTIRDFFRVISSG